ncbi:MAG: winged helix-turn-helix domain-containing protein [Candidatus Aenigmatarchaeota archaeon]
MKVVVQTSESALKTFRLLSNMTVKNIINYLKGHGPSPPSRISKGLEISPSTASRCLQDMLEYNIVKARWETRSIQDRPLKVYSLVPNVLRFEFVLTGSGLKALKPGHHVRFKGDHLVEFKEGDKRGVYASLESVPFKFEGLTGEVLKEIAKGEHAFEALQDKFKEKQQELVTSLKHLMTLGLIEIVSKK